jgi:SAM-dependent methyltransferase
VDVVHHLKKRLPMGARRPLGHLRRAARGAREGALSMPGHSVLQYWDSTARALHASPLPTTPVTDLLYERLDAADVAEVESRLEGEDARKWAKSRADERRVLALAYGVHYEVEPVISKTGLSPAMPPEEVHSMGRGSLAAGGAYYYGDLVVDALAAVGASIEPATRALDFGCSSGRVVRVLQAAYPRTRWFGCDPIGPAIAWAHDNLPAIEFWPSPQDPPLPYEAGQFDLVFAISIWSHFDTRAALRWFREMHRIVAPGGHLIITTHGYQSMAHYSWNGMRSPEQLAEIGRSLFSRGFWYAPEFGTVGDHGVVSEEWGTAFFTPEWLLTNLTPEWRVAHFAPGRAEGNQDLYVLERR